jgi:TolB-like protein
MTENNGLGKASINFLLWGVTALLWLSLTPNVSAQTYDFDEGLETLTRGLVSENRGILKKKKIAVFGIIESKSGKKWEVSSHIEDGIVDALVKNGCRVIERRRIQDVIQKEIKKSTELWFDQARVAQFGKLVGADFVVTGSYVLWGQGTIKISVRAINVSDGEIVAADKVKILTDRIASLLKPEKDENRPKKVRVIPEKPVKVKSIEELTHESGKLGKYKALIIGINDYKGPKIPDLETATNDATAMAKILKEQYGFEVKLLLDHEATKGAIYGELRRLTGSTKSNDSVLIYFSGHGDLDRTYDGGWWIPADAIGGNPVTYLDNIQVQKAMRSMKARHVLLVSDSCYSGTLFGEARSLPHVIDDKYYLSLYNEKSRWGITSGNKTPVSDQGTGGHSVFAYQLLKELGESDKPFLSTHELYARIAPVIANNAEQTPICRPILNTGDQGGEFVFVASVKKEPPLTVPKVHQSILNKDMLFWQSVKDSNDPALFEAYLKAFPNGIFALIAKRKIENFKQKNEAAATAPVVLESKLFVEVEPRDARVRILNIVPKFHQGIALDPGSYRLNVSAPGYTTQDQWIKLTTGEEKHVNIQLSPFQKGVETSHSTPKPTPEVAAPPPPVSEPKPEAAPQTEPAAPVRIFNNFKRAFESWKDGALSGSSGPSEFSRGDTVEDPSSDGGP